MDKFDLVVIGSGPAGEKGAVQAAYFGKRVALIEKEPVLGGAAANTGTLPSKTLRETALFLSGFRHRELEGLQLAVREKVSVRDFMARECIVVEGERTRIFENLEKHNVTIFRGTASFVDSETVRITSEGKAPVDVQGDKFLIATGSHPFRPKGFCFEDPCVYDSNEILQLEEIPTSMLVVGGGVIGCEYACMFAILGVDVTIVEKRDCLIGFLDREIGASLHAQMESKGIRIILGDSVAECHDGQPIEVTLASGTKLTVQTVLVSSGRCGNVEGLGLETIGVTYNDRGQIHVDENFQTQIPHIYAAGDVIGNPALASTSMEQARVAMVHAFNLKYKSSVSTILPFGVYTIPECSMVGDTEESLIARNIPYVVGIAPYSGNSRGQIIGDHHGFLKLIFHQDDMRLLGAHMIGEMATELIHVGLTALLMNATAELFIKTCFNYPTLSEIYKYATYDALGRRYSMGK